jgi:sugar lactone lactonase YvrE
MQYAPPTTILDDLQFPEGPRWFDGRLYFSDMWGGRVMSMEPNGQTSVLCELETRPSGLGFLPDGRLLVVSMADKRLMVLDRHLGLREVADISHLCPGPANDMVVDSVGRAYIGNFGFDYSGGEPFQPTVMVRVDPSGEATVVAEDLAFPNGAVITPDGRTLIVAETFAQRLTAFDIAPNGSFSNRRIWAQLERGHPDGICLDSEGHVWVASPTTAECIRVSEGGAILDTIPMTAGRGAYACALGGDDGRTLYICTAEGDEHDRVAGRSRGWIEATAL